MEVSAVGIPAYAGADILAVRHAQLVQEDLLAPFKNPPVVNLEPIPTTLVRWTVADIDETLKKAGWFEVAEGAGVWRAPDEADDPAGRKYTTANAALEAVRLKAAEPPKAKSASRKKSEE